MNKRLMCLAVRALSGCLLVAGTCNILWAQDTITILADEEINEEFVGDYQYFDLGCNANEWEGYFAPGRWQQNLTTGEVGADPVLLSEFVQQQEQNALVIFDTEREEVETWSIDIPVDGYLAFRLLAAGPTAEGEITVSVNGEVPPGKIRANGIYYSPFLRAGDRFSLHIPAGSTAYQWSQLRFHSNYSAVIVHSGAVAPQERFQGIRQGRIQRVIFPDDRYGAWPIFDMDGDPLTTYDRQSLQQPTERFEVKYEDSVVAEDGIHYLQRTFTIRERCRKGNWLRRSRKWAVLPIIGE